MRHLILQDNHIICALGVKLIVIFLLKENPMRIIVLVDSLIAGGVQREMTTLAVLLKQRQYDVQVISYFSHDFFKPVLDRAQIPQTIVPHKNKLHRLLAVRKAIRESQPDVVIGLHEYT